MMHLAVRLARNEADLRAAQALRYRVFVQEMGADGPLVDHAAKLERDRFDAFADHLLLVDSSVPCGQPGHVVGVYRLLPQGQADAAGGFYCDAEFDLQALITSGRRLLELGRSCVDPAYRGGAAMLLMWQALAEYAQSREVEILFGAASFRGTDPQALAQPLSLLHHHYLAPPALRVRAREAQPMNLLAPEQLDRKAALAQLPPLIKAYLRIGGVVGEGAYIDHAFRTTDICLILDTHNLARAGRSLAAAASGRA